MPKIFDLITKRNLDTTSKTFKTRLNNQMNNGEVHFSIVDLKNLGFIKPDSNKKVSKKIENILIQKAENVRMENFYINKDHKDFCEGKQVLLPKSVINTDYYFKFTHLETPLLGVFNVQNFNYLKDDSKFKIKIIGDKDDEQDRNFITHVTSYNKRTLFNDTNQYDENVMDIKWFNNLNNYIRKLSPERMFALHAYTTPFAKININKYLMKTLDMNQFKNEVKIQISKKNMQTKYFFLFYPLYNIIVKNIDKLNTVFDKTTYINKVKENRELILNTSMKNTEAMYRTILTVVNGVSKEAMDMCLQDFVNTLTRTIEDSPSTTKKMILFISGTPEELIQQSKMGVFSKSKTFVSANLYSRLITNQDDAYDYDDKRDYHKMGVITVLPKTKAIWLGGLTSNYEEHEFLLGMNTTYVVREKNTKMQFNNYDICFKNFGQNMKVSKITAS